MGSAQELLNRMWADVQQSSMEAEEARAKANPLKYKLSRVMERGKSLGYRYWSVKVGRREVRYCYSVNRNVAGFYLGWREVETAKAVKRDQWAARRVKQRLIELAQARAKAHKARLAKAKL